MSAFTTETVLAVRHWTDTLFSFKTTRSQSFRFSNGQFTMLGLEDEGRPLVRAYSMASPNYDDALEFFSIKVPDGPLTSRLQHVKVDDPVLVGRKPTGTLVVDNLLPGRPRSGEWPSPAGPRNAGQSSPFTIATHAITHATHVATTTRTPRAI